MRILRWLHRWLGLGLGLFIAVIGLTGSWLIYEREIATPEYVLKVNTAPMPLQMLYLKANVLLPANQDVQILFPRTSSFPYIFRTKEKQVVINQYSGDIITIRSPDYWPAGFFLHLHSELSLGKVGKQLTGWVGIGLMLITSIGIYLWRPGKWKTGFQLRLNKSPLIWHYDLHRLIGILSAPLLIVAFVTGVSLSFSKITSTLINEIFNHHADKPPLIEPTTPTEQASLDTMLINANKAIQGGRVSSMLIPASTFKPIIVRTKMLSDPHPNGLNLIYLHPQNGIVLDVAKINQADPAKRWFNWAFPIHTGQILRGHLWMLFTVGIMPAFLMLTGVYIFLLRRFKAHKKPPLN